jgi:hypothetical protein
MPNSRSRSLPGPAATISAIAAEIGLSTLGREH